MVRHLLGRAYKFERYEVREAILEAYPEMDISEVNLIECNLLDYHALYYVKDWDILKHAIEEQAENREEWEADYYK